jgi:microbial collagenase
LSLPARRLTSRVVPLLVLAWLLPACEELPNVPPSAAFIYSPVSPIVAGSTGVVFNASGSFDSDGRIVSYVWDFGDGTPSQSVDGPATSHVFPDRPPTCIQIVYAVLLTVNDDKGDRGTASQNVSVTENCPPR